MKTTWRFLLALSIAVAISACKTTEPEPEPVTEPEPAPIVEEAVTTKPLNPRDYTSDRAVENFDNPESLLSKRVIYFDFDKSEVKAEYRAIVAAHAAGPRLAAPEPHAPSPLAIPASPRSTEIPAASSPRKPREPTLLRKCSMPSRMTPAPRKNPYCVAVPCRVTLSSGRST